MIETDKCQFLYNLNNNMLKKTKEIYIMTTIRSKTNKNYEIVVVENY